ncbi:HNH endonuclease [Devosia sp. CAU 1758]
MPFAVLNVRPSRQKSLAMVRIDNRNKDLAFSAIGRTVLLYAPRDEARHGYFGKAEIAGVRLDATHRRFMFLDLYAIETFARTIRLENVAEPLESLAYRPDGSIAFSYFSTGIRLLCADDQQAIDRMENALAQPRGFRAPAQPVLSAPPGDSAARPRILRDVALRDAQLRWVVLEHYGSACAVCGSNHGDAERGLYEVEVCHVQALKFGGPDVITNALPMCRTHHWAYDIGLFTLAPQGQILVSNRMTPDLRTRFNGRSRAWFAEAAAIRPAAEHLRFHREMVFQN